MQELDEINTRIIAARKAAQVHSKRYQYGPEYDAAWKVVRELNEERELILSVQADADLQLKEARRNRDDSVQREENAFWMRRFNTTLAIANTAAFSAIASGLSRATIPHCWGQRCLAP